MSTTRTTLLTVAALIVGIGIGAAASEDTPTTITKTETETVTEEVVPKDCLTALLRAEDIGHDSVQFATYMGTTLSISRRSIMAVLRGDVAGLQTETDRLVSVNENLAQLNKVVDGHVRAFNVAATSCRASSQ